MTFWQSVTWDVARAGGFMAYGLLTVSVLLGLALSLRWYARAWPRWATNELHRYVTLLALVFTGIHTLAVWLDPFMQFQPAELFVPLISHYRPLWMALGIVGAYLMLAIWLSERLRQRVGYRWWRRLHYLAFGVYALATVHGLGMGSDTRTAWAMLIYCGSALAIGSLLSIRLLLPGPNGTAHPRIATASLGLLLAAVIWAETGPLRPGWNAIANNGNGSGARVALAGNGPSSASTGLNLPFTADLQGSVAQSGGRDDGLGGGGPVAIRMDATLSGGAQGSLQIIMFGEPQGGGSLAVDRSTMTLSLHGGNAVCTGSLTSIEGGNLQGVCSLPSGAQVSLDLRVQADASSNLTGTLRASAA